MKQSGFSVPPDNRPELKIGINVPVLFLGIML